MSSFLVWVIIITGFAVAAGAKSEEQKKRRKQQVEDAQRNPGEFQRSQESAKVNQEWREHRSVSKQYDQAQRQFDQEREKRNREEAVERAKMEKAEGVDRQKRSRHKETAKDPQRMPARAKNYSNPTVTPEILKRAEKEAEEDFSMDALIEQAKKNQEENCAMGLHIQEDTRDLMKQVSDLIIMGPNCTLEYERDFVGEGQDMLNCALLGSQ